MCSWFSDGTTLANQISIQEEIKSRLKSGNACYPSVQNLLSSALLSENKKIKICRTEILPAVYEWKWILRKGTVEKITGNVCSK